MVHIVFCIFNRKNLSLQCLRQLNAQSFRDFDITVFDDGSTDRSAEEIQKDFPNVHLIRGQGNAWWTRSINIAIRSVLPRAQDDDFILTINDDTSFDPDLIERLVGTSRSQNFAIVGTQQISSKGPGELGYLWDARRLKLDLQTLEKSSYSSEQPLSVDSIPARGALIPVRVFREIGLFEEDWMPHYLADLDFFLRARKKGFQILVDPLAQVKETEEKAAKLSRFSGTYLRHLKGLFHPGSPHLLKARICFFWRHGSYFASKWIAILKILVRAILPSGSTAIDT